MMIGSTSSEAASQATGMPRPQPIRSQPSGAGVAGGGPPGRSWLGANGPTPIRAARANAPYAASPSITSAKPAVSGVIPSGPMASGVSALPSAIAVSATRIPIAAGPTIAKRASSSDQATGR